jgi:hypothetical protein
MTKIVQESDGSVTLSLNIKLLGSSLEQEEQLAEALNSLGRLGSIEILESLDTNGEAIEVAGVTHSSKGEKKKSTNAPLGKS